MNCGLRTKHNGKPGNTMIEQLTNIYKGKRVFLTGHTGFKGSWMLKILSILGAEVKGYALAPENDFDLFYVLGGNALCESVIADLRNREELTKAITSFQPDYIFHLAAQPLVRLSYQIPAETFEVNAIGTANVLNGVRLLEKQCNAVLITTDKVYHNYEWLYPYRETDRLGGYDPYSASKACTELVIDSYRNSFFNTAKYSDHQKGIAVGRAGNVIGGGDWSKDRLVPDIVRALSKNEVIKIRNPYAVRPWQHVLEPLIGYLLLGAHLTQNPVQYSQAYNFGPDVTDNLSVEEMVKIAINCWGEGDYQIEQSSNRPHEAGLLKLDISKARGELGWHPQYDAQDSISRTIEWYKRFLQDRDSIINFTIEQIFNFTQSK